jgi:hypothetical protein
MAAWLSLLALSRTLPEERALRVLRALGEQLAMMLPFNIMLSFALDAIAQRQAREEGER